MLIFKCHNNKCYYLNHIINMNIGTFLNIISQVNKFDDIDDIDDVDGMY